MLWCDGKIKQKNILERTLPDALKLLIAQKIENNLFSKVCTFQSVLPSYIQISRDISDCRLQIMFLVGLKGMGEIRTLFAGEVCRTEMRHYVFKLDSVLNCVLHITKDIAETWVGHINEVIVYLNRAVHAYHSGALIMCMGVGGFECMWVWVWMWVHVFSKHYLKFLIRNWHCVVFSFSWGARHDTTPRELLLLIAERRQKGSWW